MIKSKLNTTKQICKEYKTGTSMIKLQKKYCIGYKSLKSLLKENNIATRSLSQSISKHNIDTTIFQKINCEWKAYFLGFLYADGCIYKNSAKLKLAEIDKGILDKFNNIIFHGKKKLYYYPPKQYYVKSRQKFINCQGQYTFEISNKYIIKDLLNLGLCTRKSLTIKFPSYSQVPKKFISHFIRGYFDGDGNIYVKKSRKVTICSSLNFCNTLKKFLQDNLQINTSVYFNSGIYQLVLCGKDQIIKFHDFIYNAANLYLARKKNKFNLFIM